MENNAGSASRNIESLIKHKDTNKETINKWTPRAFDYYPTPLSSSFTEATDKAYNEVLSAYNSFQPNKDLSFNEKMLVNSILATTFNVPLSEAAKNRDRYILSLTGERIEDKSFLEAWKANWDSYDIQRQIADKTNRYFSLAKNDPERMILKREIEKLELENAKNMDFSDRGFIQNGLVQSGSVFNQAFRQIAPTVAGAIIGASLTALLPGVGIAALGTMPTLATSVGMPGLVSSMAGGAVLGNKIHSISDTRQIEKGLAARDLMQITDENGNKLPDNVIVVASEIIGDINAGIEVIEPVPGFGNFIRGVSGRKALKTGINAWAKDYAKGVAKGAIGESFEEGLQSAVSSLGTYLTKAYANSQGMEYSIDAEKAFKEGLTDSVNSFIQAFVPSLAVGAGGEIIGTTTSRSSRLNKISSGGDVKSASKLQNIYDDTTVVKDEFLTTTTRKSSTDYSVDKNGNKTNSKIEPIEVILDPDDNTRMVPIDEENADRLKYLREQGATDIAIHKNIAKEIEIDNDTLNTIVAQFNGIIDENNVYFRTQEDRNLFLSDINEFVEVSDDGIFSFSDGNMHVDFNTHVIDRVFGEKTEENIQSLARNISSASKNIGINEARVLSEFIYALPKTTRDEILRRNNGDLVQTVSESGFDIKDNLGASLIDNARIILSEDADESTFAHEAFHIALAIDEDSRKKLVSSFKKSLSMKNERTALLKALDNAAERGIIESAEKTLSMLDGLNESNNLSKEQLESLTELFEYYLQSNAKDIPENVRSIFQKIGDMIRRIYNKIKGKNNALPKRINESYSDFFSEDTVSDFIASDIEENTLFQRRHIQQNNINSDTPWTNRTSSYDGKKASVAKSFIDGKLNKSIDMYTTKDIEDLIDAGIFVPDDILSQHNSPIVSEEIALRRTMLAMITDSDRELADKEESKASFLKKAKELHNDIWNTNIENMYGRFYDYYNTLTVKELISGFKEEFNNLESLIRLKKILGRRKITTYGNDGIVRSRLVTANNNVYRKLAEINPNSTSEDVRKVLRDISYYPRQWIKAYYKAVIGYDKVAGLIDGDEKLLNSMTTLSYLSSKSIDYSFIDQLRISDYENKTFSEIKEIRKSFEDNSKGEFKDEYLDRMLDEIDELNLSEQEKIKKFNERIKEIKKEEQEKARAARQRLIAKIKLDKLIKRNLSIDVSKYDARLNEVSEWLYAFMHNKDKLYQGITISQEESFELNRIKKGLSDSEGYLLSQIGDDGLIVFEESFLYDSGYKKFDKNNIPFLLKGYLPETTVDYIENTNLSWNRIPFEIKENIANALIKAREEAKRLKEKADNRKRERRWNITSSLAKSAMKNDLGITENDREYISQKLNKSKGELKEKDILKYKIDHAEDFITPKEMSNIRKSFNKAWGSYKYAMLKIQRVALALDGGKEGAFYDAFVRKPYLAYEEKTRNINNRFSSFNNDFDRIINKDNKEEFKKNKSWLKKEQELKSSRYNTEKQKFTGWNILGINIYSRNIKGFQKLISEDGNGIDIEEVARINPEYTKKFIEADLTQRNEIKADKRDRYEKGLKEKTYPRTMLYMVSEEKLTEVLDKIEDGKIQSTVPLFVTELANSMIEHISERISEIQNTSYTFYNAPIELVENYFPLVNAERGTADLDLLNFVGKRAKVNNGMIHSRTDSIYKLNLNPMTIFYSAIKSQENFINMTGISEDLNYVMSKGNIGSILQSVEGFGASEYLDGYRKTVAGINDTTLLDIERLMNKVLGNVAVSKLGLNLMSSLKQLISIIPAITSGEINIADFGKGLVFFFNNKDDVNEMIKKHSPSIAHSTMNIEYARSKETYETTDRLKSFGKLQEVSMWIIGYVDRGVKKAVWISSFNKNINKGFTIEESAFKATQLIEKTQSTSNPLSLAPLQKMKNPFARSVFLFSNDLFQMWNVLFGDIPANWKAASDIKEKLVAIENALGILGVSLVSAILAGGWIGEDDEDNDRGELAKDFFSSLLSNDPIVGKSIATAIDGFSSDMLGLPGDIIQLFRTGLDDEKSVGEKTEKIFDALISSGEIFGLPTVAIQRGKYILFGTEQDDNWDFKNLWYSLGKGIGDALQ